ncbi:hypothetical protein JYU34_006776 [Plutella xylostella]|uniref:C2H2-type domain-containing protein n=1 Tax=Plutella xylostella TaxID=51655 RepID=A0ABQ7QSS7_PLUXY|nr:hypothetical protein JYU34_006776 [Plutella xylostella]
MDRVTQLRAEPGGAQDADSSAASEAYLSANDSSKYFSLTEEDSSFVISPGKDVSLSSVAAAEKPAPDSDPIISDLSPINKKNDLLDSYKIGKHIEAANILSGGVDIFDDNDNSYDGNELVIDDNVGMDVDEKSNPEVKLVSKEEQAEDDSGLADGEAAIPSKDTEVVLQIDGKNVDAIDIGNGLYLYRREGAQEELAAVQIVDTDQQQPSFKFLKVRENAEGNLEVYEEIEIEVPKDVPLNAGTAVQPLPHLPIKDISKAASDSTLNKATEKPKSLMETTSKTAPILQNKNPEPASAKGLPENMSEVNINGKPVKLNEPKISPLVGSFTPMTYHSTPNKDGIPLTKTMVDQHLHPSRHSEAKKKIEVNTENCKQKLLDTPTKSDKSDSGSEILEMTDCTKIVKGSIETLSEKSCSSLDKVSGDVEISKDIISDCKESGNIDSNSTPNIFHLAEHEKDNSSKVASVTTEKEDLSETKLVTPNTIVDKSDDSNIPSENPDQEIHKVTDTVKSIEGKVTSAPVADSKTPGNEIICSTMDDKKATEVKPVENKVEEDSVPKESQVLIIDDKDQTDNIPVYHVDGDSMQLTDDIEIVKDDRSAQQKAIDMVVKTYDEFVKNAVAVSNAKKSGSKDVTSETKEEMNPEIATVNVSETKTNIDAPIPIPEPASSGNMNTSDIKKVASKDEPTPLATKSLHSLEPKKNNTNEKNEGSSSTGELPTVTDSIKSHDSLPKQLTKVDKAVERTQNDIELKGITDPKAITSEEIVRKAGNAIKSELKMKSTESNLMKQANQVMKEIENETKTETKTETSETKVETSGLKTETSVSKTETSESKTESSASKTETSASKTETSQSKTEISVSKTETLESKTLIANKKTVDIPDNKSRGNNTTSIKTEVKVTPKDIPNKSTVNDDFINKYVHKGLSMCIKQNVEKPKLIESTFNASSITALKNIAPTITKVSPPSVSELRKDDKPALPTEKKDVIKEISSAVDNKPKSPVTANSLNNNAVPFGMWTEVNKQDYLNKIKETKVTSNNTHQIKQTNDLNRRDVLKKIDSQRHQINILAAAKTQAAKTQELNKQKIKNETMAFVKKTTVTTQDPKQPVKPEPPKKQEPMKVTPKHSIVPISQPLVIPPPTDEELAKIEAASKVPCTQTLIDKTIEDYLMDRRPPVKFNLESATRLNAIREKSNDKITSTYSTYQKYVASKDKSASILNDIEMKMNELHGVPIDRPAQESPQKYNDEFKSSHIRTETHSKVMPMLRVNKIPPLVPFTNKNPIKGNESEELSEEEIIEHVPVTGDMDLEKKRDLPRPYMKEKTPVTQTVTSVQPPFNAKKDNVITENEFDKFARRNSITYENCMTVNFDANQQHQVVQSVVEKDLDNKHPRSLIHGEVKPKLQTVSNVQAAKLQASQSRYVPPHADDTYNKSKVQMAYHSAMTAKHHKASTITMPEDKPVKVVFIDSSTEFVPSQLNVQGRDLSPAKKYAETDSTALSSCDSLDSDVLDLVDESKLQDSTRKSKHQRKQVLTPVDAPDMELIEPLDLGLEASPKKRRRVEDYYRSHEEKSPKSFPKKSYLLGRSSTQPETLPEKAPVARSESHAVSAIDSLVKAAELLETQAGRNSSMTNTSSDSSAQTPAKRGRGRPRKHPLPSPPPRAAPASPLKKPRLERDRPKRKPVTSSDDSTDDEMVRENWTMGKINENIVCPICSKLFRSENVVFKHVKHCAGPSPSRSASDGRGTSQSDSDNETLASKQSHSYKEHKPATPRPAESSVIVIEDTPVKPKASSEKAAPAKAQEKRASKPQSQHNTNNLTCETCGKTFRQLSYLVSHKMQHKNDEPKKPENPVANKSSVFSCDVCKKEFRKLHHLVQHRIIHNPPAFPRRGSSTEQPAPARPARDPARPADDQSAAFRCEPCDKSFRKLHHLVEHRETHDGKNKQKTPPADKPAPPPPETLPPPPPQCDVCKKTFRKLHHLIEHKEQHHEAGSEKSDDKSVKSTLSTKDIIHECSLCYMVFPNEHSLNKHSVFCQKKKKPVATKPTEPELEDATSRDSSESVESIPDDDAKDVAKVAEVEPVHVDTKTVDKAPESQSIAPIKTTETKIEEKQPAIKETPKESAPEKPSVENKFTRPAIPPVAPPKELETKKVNTEPALPPSVSSIKPKKPEVIETIVIKDTPKKKLPLKDRTAATVTKRQKTSQLPLPVIEENKQSSDDDDVRYMLNPDFKQDEEVEGKTFMKVRALKRNSLQIERPNSKDLIKRRTSLQHPPKVPRLRAKLETKAGQSISQLIPKAVPKTPKPEVKTPKPELKTPKPEPVPSTDSDDSDVKYSFPVAEKALKPVTKQEKEPTAEVEKKMPKKSLTERRKSLGGIAKRKSLGKPATPRHKLNPVKEVVRKRTTEPVGHRCDCGQLFNSAALLSRHTSLAHTPPRVRRRRSPPPPPPAHKQPRNSTKTPPRKPSVKTDDKNTTKHPETRLSTSDKTPKTTGKPKTETATKPKSSVKARKSAAHRGVPVPEKMRKLMEKEKLKK